MISTKLPWDLPVSLFLVVTNFHVIRSAASLTAVNNNGALFLFEKIVAEPTGVDLAILKFRANDFLS